MLLGDAAAGNSRVPFDSQFSNLTRAGCSVSKTHYDCVGQPRAVGDVPERQMGFAQRSYRVYVGVVALRLPTGGKLLPDIVVAGFSRPWQPSRRARAGVRNALLDP